MACYAIRVHRMSDETLPKVSAWLSKECDSYVIAEEADASRVHFQGFVYSEKRVDTLSKSLVRAMPENKGNRGYSLRACKEFDRYKRYIMKGTETERPKVVLHQYVEYSAEWADKLWSDYWAENKRLKNARKSKPLDLQVIADWAKQNNASRRDIVDKVLESKRGKAINIYQIVSTVNGVLLLMGGDEAQAVRNAVLEKIVRYARLRLIGGPELYA
jgi:hypothetical protein